MAALLLLFHRNLVPGQEQAIFLCGDVRSLRASLLGAVQMQDASLLRCRRHLWWRRRLQRPDSFDVPRQLPKSSFVSRLLASGPGLLDLTEHCLALRLLHQCNIFIKPFGIGVWLDSLLDNGANQLVCISLVSALTQLFQLALLLRGSFVFYPVSLVNPSLTIPKVRLG